MLQQCRIQIKEKITNFTEMPLTGEKTGRGGVSYPNPSLLLRFIRHLEGLIRRMFCGDTKTEDFKRKDAETQRLFFNTETQRKI